MLINVPKTLKRHEPFLKQFMEGMIFKLHVNSHKDDTAEKDIPILLDHLADEVQEFRDQLTEKADDPNSLSELMDMSNFSYLLFHYLRNQGVADEREQFVKEFLRVETRTGKVYARKTRSGSRYNEGEEIRGSLKAGRVYIRVQHVTSGSMISVSRAELVWFAANGSWPNGDIVHLNGVEWDDSIGNLALKTDETTTDDFPFLFEKVVNGQTEYGYQRRHKGILVRVGSWPDKKTAAINGIAAWKRRIKEMDNV
jgi:hypothetical protein